MKKTIRFDLTEASDSQAYGNVIRAYTEQGLTFELSQEGAWVSVELTGGY